MNPSSRLSLVVTGSLLLALSASAQMYMAHFSGLEEVPPNASPGNGMATAMLTGNTLVVDGNFAGLMGNYTASHIHAAPAGSNGPVIFALVNNGSGTAGGWTGSSNTFNLSASQLATLQSGGYYINIHSQVIPGGEIRGQLLAMQSSGTEDQPRHFHLGEAFPNPFNPTTRVSFDLARTASARLAVYNIAGDEVAVLAEGLLAAGEHTAEFAAGGMPSGIYFLRLESEGTSETRKLTLLK
jgi:hypothetical protein